MEEQMLANISKQLEELVGLLTKEMAKAKVGRPDKKHIVFQYRDRYPKRSKTECMKTTELSMKTVSKYWDSWKEQGEKVNVE